MPSPTPALLHRLRHLTEAQQLAWLDQWSRALMEGQPPPPIPRVASFT